MGIYQDTVDEASALLNDAAQTLWDASSLRPFIQKAHRELQVKLSLNGIPVLKKTVTILTVPPNTTILPTQPSDLVEPIELFERSAGSSDQFDLMQETRWEVDEVLDEELRFWYWDQELIQFLGATQARDVKLHYVRGITVPEQTTDPLGFINANMFLGPRTAAIAAASVGGTNLANTLNNDAQKQLNDVIRFNVTGSQSLPVRRIGYRRLRSKIFGIR